MSTEPWWWDGTPYPSALEREWAVCRQMQTLRWVEFFRHECIKAGEPMTDWELEDTALRCLSQPMPEGFNMGWANWLMTVDE